MKKNKKEQECFSKEDMENIKNNNIDFDLALKVIKTDSKIIDLNCRVLAKVLTVMYKYIPDQILKDDKHEAHRFMRFLEEYVASCKKIHILKRF
jgi:hypothetical protein